MYPLARVAKVLESRPYPLATFSRTLTGKSPCGALDLQVVSYRPPMKLQASPGLVLVTMRGPYYRFGV